MLTPVWNPNRRQLRQFAAAGACAGLLFGALAWRVSPAGRGVIVWGLVAGAFAVLGAFAPLVLRLPYVALMALAAPLGWLISNLLLRLLYYFVFTPLGLLFRIFGRDPLQLKRPGGGTYWRPFPSTEKVRGYFRQA